MDNYRIANDPKKINNCAHLYTVEHHASHHHTHPSQQVWEQHLKTDCKWRLLLNFGNRYLSLQLSQFFPRGLEYGWQKAVVVAVSNPRRAGIVTPNWALSFGEGLFVFFPLARLLRWFIFKHDSSGGFEKGELLDWCMVWFNFQMIKD